NTLRQWQDECPEGKLGLVFPNGQGNIENLANITRRGYDPLQIECDIVRFVEHEKDGETLVRFDKDGKPMVRPKYGLHALRHFYASWCINRKQDGGLELPPKTLQERLGHASIALTMDRYAHLFPKANDGFDDLDAAHEALINAT
ncbi:MAG: site-specific integrase, partial [Alphaproteobacteria bacterium]